MEAHGKKICLDQTRLGNESSIGISDKRILQNRLLNECTHEVEEDVKGRADPNHTLLRRWRSFWFTRA